MPNRFLVFVCVGLAALLVCGCGTVTTFVKGADGTAPDRKPFGGVREDAEFLTRTSSGEGLFAIVALADLPLSLVGDVFTLPWTIRAARVRAVQKSRAVP